ncbi:MAG: S41 family peptidase [Chloroflexota bacterium]
MSLPAFLLLVATLVQLVVPIVGASERWWELIWLVIFGLAGWQLWHDALLPSMMPIYLLLVIMCFIFLIRRYLQWGNNVASQRRLWSSVIAMLLSLPLLAIPVVEATVLPFDGFDYRQDGWVEGFDGMHATLQKRYAFGKWKQINWDELYARHYPQVVAAAQAGDEKAYYVALRGYVFGLSDGHVGIDGEVHGAVETAVIGGDFGFALLKLDDGRVIAQIVDPHGAASRAGMAWGAEILTWNGLPIHEAVASVSPVWASRPPATAQNLSLTQHQLLTRAPVGAEIAITFRNQDERQTESTTLKATNDRFKTYRESVHWQMAGPPSDSVDAMLLDDGIGYIRIAALEPTSQGLDPVDAMEQMMQQMVADGVQALVLDVRGNRGGLDTLVPAMMGYFAPTRLYYEGITVYNPLLQEFSRLFSLHVDPNDLQFTNPVVVLVDHRTKSSGEGFGLIAKALPNATVIGMYGTDGSFGMSSSSIMLPTGIEVIYPWGQSVDQNGVVQVDGDAQLVGGVHPDSRVPLSLETARAIYLDGEDVVFDFALEHVQRQLGK